MAKEPTPFDLVELSFTSLCSGTRPACLPGDLLGGAYLGRQVPLMEVRAALLRRGTAYPTRDLVLAELVRRARTGEPWGTGLAGVLLPGMRAALARVAFANRWVAADLEAEALAGLAAAVRDVDLSRPGIAARVVWAARRQADAALARELGEWRHRADTDRPAHAAGRWHGASADIDEAPDEPDDDVGPGAPVPQLNRPCSPDAVLEEARREGALTDREAELVAATRLEGVSVRDYARMAGEPLASTRQRRYRAEQKIVNWLRVRGISVHFGPRNRVTQVQGARRPEALRADRRGADPAEATEEVIEAPRRAARRPGRRAPCPAVNTKETQGS